MSFGLALAWLISIQAKFSVRSAQAVSLIVPLSKKLRGFAMSQFTSLVLLVLFPEQIFIVLSLVALIVWALVRGVGKGGK